MSRRRIGIYGVSEESLRLVRLLAANPEVEVACLYAADRESALTKARRLGSDFAAEIEAKLVADLETFLAADLQAVVDEGQTPGFSSLCPTARERGIQIVSPLTARLLWGYGVAPRDRKGELLQALNEVVESVELTIDSDELFTRMLEIAVGVTGAEGGSLMLLDDERQTLFIRVAIGVEPELWPKIRVAVGEGISGRVAADAQPLRIQGRADRRRFQIVRERLDVESALCVPLVHDDRVLGVLNLHHSTRSDLFSDEDLRFMEQLAALDAQIMLRAQEHESLRRQAARYEAVREIHGLLGGPAPLLDRLQRVCHLVAGRMGGGIANLYLYDDEGRPGELRLSATSLEGGGFGGEYRIVPGQGVDGRAAATRRPVFLRAEGGELAYAALPLLAGERLLGVLATQAGNRILPRGRAAEEGLLEIAAAVAEGVSQAHREARMATRAARVGAINETGIRMLSATDVTEVTRLATSSLALILDADHAILRLQDPETRRYGICSYFGSADDQLQQSLFALDKRASVEAIKRRTAFLVRDLAEKSDLAEHADDFRSLISAPLKQDGHVIGTVSIYDKVAVDRFFPGRFNDDDLQIFARFVSYVERAIANARVHAAASEHRNFDAETGLPNASYFGTRVQQEIARAGPQQTPLVVAVCWIENWKELCSRVNPAHAHRLLLATSDALRSRLRDFDVLGRTGESQFSVLMPEPGPDPARRVADLSRAVAEIISQDEVLNDPLRIALAFGYAVHPQDGATRETLQARASEPRIRMV